MELFRYLVLLVAPFFETNYMCIQAQQCQGRTFDITEKSLSSFSYYQAKTARSQIECVKHCKRDETCEQAYYWAGKGQCFLAGAKNGNDQQLSGDEALLVEITLIKTECDSRTSLKGEDCAELYKRGIKQSGAYTVTPRDGGQPINVYCDMTTDGGGWTVFHTRKDGSEDLYRGWNDYKIGFGSLTGEFWLGNDNLNRLTNQGTQQLRVDLEDWPGNARYAVYDTFSIATEGDNYTLSIGEFSGDAGDSLAHHRGSAFSTKERDNDANSGHCAVRFKGAWWYNNCLHSNLNGLYYIKGETSSDDGVFWKHFKGWNYSLKRTSMKFRPVGFKSK